MATAAAHQVQSITELLEMILYELPPVDILVYQRVCQRWKEIITRSEKFQRALFFEPVSKETLMWRQDLVDETPLDWYSVRTSMPQRIILNPMRTDLLNAMKSGRDKKAGDSSTCTQDSRYSADTTTLVYFTEGFLETHAPDAAAKQRHSDRGSRPGSPQVHQPVSARYQRAVQQALAPADVTHLELLGLRCQERAGSGGT